MCKNVFNENGDSDHTVSQQGCGTETKTPHVRGFSSLEEIGQQKIYTKYKVVSVTNMVVLGWG
ncbi:hypothetical protein CER18_08375 [Bartonella tribocorum]|uniref:Uncharacterized protein n=1 Tax=Bartonella tribocorum TaxID=85701 RepID=A0A2N9Y8S2_9HYPH|nr:hypothetical protein CER18_08375 [Bartonella tribocorum]